MRNYPTDKATSLPGTGKLLYEHVKKNIEIPAACNSVCAYEKLEQELGKRNDYAFKGGIPEGMNLELVSLGNHKFESPTIHTFTGQETRVFVSDLSRIARIQLNIPDDAKEGDIVYDKTYSQFEELTDKERFNLRHTSESVPKTIDTYFRKKKNHNYSERDAVKFISTALTDFSSKKCWNLLFGSSSLWSAMNYYSKNTKKTQEFIDDFTMALTGDGLIALFEQDLLKILPSMLYMAGSVGENPVSLVEQMDLEIPGAMDAARYISEKLK